METTRVIFRRWKKGSNKTIIALFPRELGNTTEYTCMSYEHVGQHGSADPIKVIRETIPALPTDEDVIALKEELCQKGYVLKVIKKHTRFDQSYRNSLLKKFSTWIEIWRRK